MNENCKICSEKVELLGEGTILQKYKIKYFQCSVCGFVQTEDSYWLNESYSDAINRTDVGLISRNLLYSRVVKSILNFFFNKKARFIDYGAGYGLFVRMMRDFGFDFYWHDIYCENIFAKDFTASDSERFEVLTAFEVFEHLNDPSEELDKMLEYSDSILFSTELFPASAPKPGHWWYYGLDHGQHIAIYSKRSLEILAAKRGLYFYSNGKNLHLFTKKKISSSIFKVVANLKIGYTLSYLYNNHSLLDGDFQDSIQKLKSKNK